MKKVLATLAVGAVMAAGTGIGMAFASGVPEVDEANATIQMGGAKFIPTTCAGEDGISYLTYRGTWKGGETDVTPGSTDYNLSGNLVVSKLIWTINLSTQRGELRGTAVLSTPNSAGGTVRTYSGPLTLITQGLPSAGAVVQARGWINAATYSPNGVVDGGSLLANVEMQILPGFSATGEFGNSTMNFPDFSVTTINQTC